MKILLALVVVALGYKVWRVRQFQKVSGFGFIKAWLVLGK
jgi:hypothetical protein